MLSDEGDYLAVALGSLAVLSACLVDHSQPIVAIMHVWEVLEQMAGGLLGFIELAGIDQIDDGV